MRPEEEITGGSRGDIRPVPDPTALTNALVNSAVGNLEARILVRLDGMERATELRLGEMHKIPADIDREIVHLRSFIEQKFKGVEIKFDGIALQFAERDIRVDTGARSSKEALDAALLAAKELVGATNLANAEAATKAETSFLKSLDQITTLIKSTADATDARIADLKERIDRGEGGNAGAATYRAEQRLDYGTLISVIAVIFVVIGIAASVTIAVVVH